VPLHLYSAVDGGAFPLPAGAALLSVADGQAIDRTVDASSETLNVRITDGMLSLGAATPSPLATATASSTASATPTASATATVSPPTSTASATATAASTATVTAPVCVGDCDHSGSVGVNELVAGVSIALGSQPLSSCPAFDCTGTGQIQVSC